MANFNININKKNELPPSQVGDGALTVDFGQTIVFTTSYLTTSLVPPYQHPDGEPAAFLKITQLATEGELQLNGVPVTLNQIISFSDIDSGLFTYVPDISFENGVNLDFEFEIADAESNTFVG